MNRYASPHNGTSNTLNIGLKCHQRGDYVAAEAFYSDFQKKFPQNSQVHYLLGILASQTQRPAMAKAQIEAYLKDHPNDAQATGVLALSNFELGNFDVAYRQLSCALRHIRNSASLFHNLGQTCFKLNRFDEAINAYADALLLDPNYVNAHISSGIVFKEIKQFERAKHSLQIAISLEPTNAEAFFFLGNVCRELNELQASSEAYKRALEIKPNYIEAAINCGNSYKDLGLITKAIHYYDTALQLDENHPEANYNKSLVLLNDAQFESGWPLYEWRIKSLEAKHKFVQHAPIATLTTWNGLPLEGRLLVLPEQGIGDQIFFSGMLNDLRNKASNLTVCADSRLVSLLARSYPAIDFVDDVNSVDLSQFKAQIHFGSVGQFLRPNAQSFNGVISPYLTAKKDQSYQLRSAMKRSDRLLCGISWLSKNADHGQAKSLSLVNLENALTLPGFDFVDLQYGDTRDERAQFFAEYGINIIKREEIDNFSDIDGLASLIAACDLVVTVSNTTAHLACALGKPTLVLLPQNSAVFWYWHNREMHSPWYPSAVLLRQQELGGWPQVLQAVCQILEGMQ